MVIHEAHKTINALRQALPRSFVFVIDTTDRSFIYKSGEHTACEKTILQIDQLHGIDILSRKDGFYLEKHNSGLVGIRTISTNTYVGFCLPKDHHHLADIAMAEGIIRNEGVLM